MRKPIVILAASRSGSSLTAGIFKGHGCWVGRVRSPDPLNPKGYFENLDVKAKINEKYWLKKKGTSQEFHDWMVGLLKKDQNYNGGPWLVKHGAPPWWIWEDFDPLYINMRREYLDSQRSRKTASMPMGEEVWSKHLEAFEHTKQRGALEIWPDKFKDGNFEELKAAIEHCGLTYDQKIVDNFYEREYWHA